MEDSGNNIVKEKSGNVISDINENTNGISTMSTCSDALTIIGMVHSGSYAAAAFALGLTGGASVAIPVIVGAAYSLFSLAC